MADDGPGDERSGAGPGGYDWGERLPAIDAGRVRLRALGDADLAALFAVFSDPEVARYLSRPAHATIAETGELLRSIDQEFRARRLFQWGIEERGERRVIGTVTLFHLDLGHRRAEVGYVLGRPHWGRGLGGEALAALIGFAFGRLALHRLEADVDPRNQRSLALLERLGFRREGYLRQRYHVGGEIQDTVFLGLLRDEWQQPELPGGR